MRIPAKLYAAIRMRALDHAPAECCGLIAVTDTGDVTDVYHVRNVHDRPLDGYVVDPDDQYWTLVDIEERGHQLGGVYHSHPLGPPEMSATDLRLAYPGVVHVIVGMAHGLEARAWRVDDAGLPTAEPLELIDAT